jgi:hypothetical protein
MRLTIVIASVLALAACGGATPTSSTTLSNATEPTAGGEPAAKTPGLEGDEVVYQKVATSTIMLPAGRCSYTGFSLGELWADSVPKADGVRLSATCDGAHCEVLVATSDPDCEDCDGTDFWIQFDLDEAGEIIPSSLLCRPDEVSKNASTPLVDRLAGCAGCACTASSLEDSLLPT